MERTFSIATLLLVIAILAVALASIRAAAVRTLEGQSRAIATPIAIGALAGGAVGCVLAFGYRGSRPFWHPKSWPRIVAGTLGGIVLGGGAGAQATAAVSWWIIVLMPPLIVGMTALVVTNRRRQSAIDEARIAVRRSIAAEESLTREGSALADEPL